MWYNSEKNVIKIKFSCIPESASVKICAARHIPV